MTDFPHGVRESYTRLINAIWNPFSRPPTSPNSRLGIIDLTHAYSNFWTEVARAHPHAVGRGIAWGSGAAIILLLLA